MLALLKLLQSLVKTLHSDGTPHQIALGLALGAALGLTPVVNVHNAVVLVLLIMLNVSFGAGLLGWAVFTPIGFLLDPLFHRIGAALLLDTPGLQPLWTRLDHTPLVPFTNFGNTVVLGSVVGWLALFLPIYALGRVAVRRYRTTYGARVQQWRVVQALKASRIYNVWQWFHA
ncbi:MAG TPA: TIGR03546 family protein [Gemmatimonadaceae bacterium]|nr:TIGR03546 family protein [Gemmatimonadaceae bacterium]